jgi:hypothetical protein
MVHVSSLGRGNAEWFPQFCLAKANNGTLTKDVLLSASPRTSAVHIVPLYNPATTVFVKDSTVNFLWQLQLHEKPVRIADFRVEIWTRDLRNTKQEC